YDFISVLKSLSWVEFGAVGGLTRFRHRYCMGPQVSAQKRGANLGHWMGPRLGAKKTGLKLRTCLHILFAYPGMCGYSGLLNTRVLLRWATTRRALSASCFACGSSSRALTTSGSASARTFNPSSWPKASMKISLLMRDFTQLMFSLKSDSENVIFSESRNFRKSCKTTSSTSKDFLSGWWSTR